MIRAVFLRRHAGLALADAERSVGNADDLTEIRQAFDWFELMRHWGALAVFRASEVSRIARLTLGPV